MGDKYDLSGDFRGSIVNIKSELKNVQQTVGEISAGDPDARQELQKLIEQLSGILEKVPPAKQPEAEAVAATAKALVDQAKAPQPNHPLLEITSDSLKRAAKNLGEIAPLIIPLATQIVIAVNKLARP